MMLKLMYVIRLLVLISLAVTAPNANAATAIGPNLMFETFRRTRPEEASTWRLGYGLGVAVDVYQSWLAVDFAAYYSNASDSFAPGSSLDEKVLTGQVGILAKWLVRESLYLGLKAGVHYLHVVDLYRPIGRTEVLTDEYNYWRPYLGIEGAVVPLSGLGVRESVLFLYDRRHERWAFEVNLGVLL